jgi:co-chaperonin GroES (HSP10)
MSEVAFKPPEKAVEAPVPKPLLWRVVIEPWEPPKRTTGGIELPEEAIQTQRNMTTVGRIKDMGSLCYETKTQSGLSLADEANKPKVGDWVLFGTYAGQRVRMKSGKFYVIINDDEILGVVDSPEDFHFYI